jgi:hypothetical protein
VCFIYYARPEIPALICYACLSSCRTAM